MQSQKRIGQNLKKARLKLELTQAEVAEKADLSANFYARLERGEEKASIETLERVLKVLRVKSSDILPF